MLTPRDIPEGSIVGYKGTMGQFWTNQFGHPFLLPEQGKPIPLPADELIFVLILNDESDHLILEQRPGCWALIKDLFKGVF